MKQNSFFPEKQRKFIWLIILIPISSSYAFFQFLKGRIKFPVPGLIPGRVGAVRMSRRNFLLFMGVLCGSMVKSPGGRFRYRTNGVKDCSLCTLPHDRENYGYITARFQDIVRTMQRGAGVGHNNTV